MSNKITLNDVFPEWYDGKGIFSAISSNNVFFPPWYGKHENNIIDIDYHGNYSGDKEISPLLEKFIDSDYKLTTQQLKKICYVIKARYEQKWKKQWEVLYKDYNPIENYNMKETVTSSSETENTITNSETTTDTTQTNTNGTNTNNGTTNNYTFGFNSFNESPTAKSTTTNNATNTNTDTTTENGTTTSNGSNSGTSSATETTTRSGNIGITTSQQMVESELRLREYNYFENVFKDVDEILTSPIYNIF